MTFNKNVQIPIKMSMEFVPYSLISNNRALDQIMARRRTGDNPLSEAIMVSSGLNVLT